MVDQDLVIFGGVKGSKWLNVRHTRQWCYFLVGLSFLISYLIVIGFFPQYQTVAVLNTSSWVWRQIKIQGSAPKPRSYPSATAVGTNRIVIFGGNNEKEAFSTVHVLEKMEGDTWQWTHPMVTGYGPCPRTGHSATLLSDGRTICIYGGWDPNEDNDDVNDDDSTTIFNDAFLLDTENWQWKKLDTSLAKRVGHDMVMQEKEGAVDTQLIAFGGRIPNNQFTNDMEMFTASLF
jgi:N-acetylneuraminic acid mutarotase